MKNGSRPSDRSVSRQSSRNIATTVLSTIARLLVIELARVGDDRLDAADVVRQPALDLARARLGEEAQRHPLEVRVERVAQVLHDVLADDVVEVALARRRSARVTIGSTIISPTNRLSRTKSRCGIAIVDQELEQVRVDQADRLVAQDRDQDDATCGPVGPEEGDDAADRPAAPLARDRREVVARTTAERPIPAAAATAAAAPTPPGRCAGPPRGNPITRRSACRDFGDALRLEPALGVDGGHAAVAGRGDGLAVAVVVDVAGDEHAVDLGVRSRRGRRGSPSRRPPASRGRPRCWAVADRDEQAVDGASRAASPVRGVAQPQARRPSRRRGPPRPRCSGGSRSWGARSARSTMILLARNVSRRWSRWTFVANRVR